MCEVVLAKSVCLGVGGKSSRKLENVVTTTTQKTMSNINIVFTNCLQMRYKLHTKAQIEIFNLDLQSPVT